MTGDVVSLSGGCNVYPPRRCNVGGCPVLISALQICFWVVRRSCSRFQVSMDISGRSRRSTASPRTAFSSTSTRRFSFSKPAIFLCYPTRWLSRFSRTYRPYQSFQHLLQAIQSTALYWWHLISQHPHDPFLVQGFDVIS